MTKKGLVSKLSELTSRGLDGHFIGGPEDIGRRVSELLVDKKYRGPIVIVYGNEGLYRYGKRARKGSLSDNRVYMIFVDDNQLNNS